MRRASRPREEAAPRVRPAGADDVAELVRLRAVMFEAAGLSGDDGAWRAPCAQVLRDGLARGDLAAFVVDHPGSGGALIACGIGLIVERLPGTLNPSGRYGHVQSMVTESAFRRRGHARAILDALIGWFRAHDVRVVDLHAAPMGEPLYRSMGFADSPQPELRWRDGDAPAVHLR